MLLSAVVALSLPASGCTWAKRMGERLPVSESAQRCEGRWFCFSDESQRELAANKAAAEQPARRAANMSVPPQGMQVAPYGAPSAMPGTPPQAMAPQPYPPVYQQPVAPAPLQAYKLPSSPEEARNMSFPAPGMPGATGIPPEMAPPGMPPEMLAPQNQQPIPGLKPYEQDLPEMKKLEPIPLIEQMKQDMDW